MKHLSMPAVLKWCGAFLAAQWLTVEEPSRRMIAALLWFMVIDFVTGLFAAYITKTASSTAGGRGLAKKILTLLLLLTCHLVEKTTGIELKLELMGALAFTVNELISIIENCARSGLPIPAPLVAALMATKRLKMNAATQEQLDELMRPAQAEKPDESASG